MTLATSLDFADADRCENLRRAAEVGRLFTDVGLGALLAPDAAVRVTARDPLMELLEAGGVIR